MVDNNRWRAKRENVTNLAYGVITGSISKRKSDRSAFLGSGSAMMRLSVQETEEAQKKEEERMMRLLHDTTGLILRTNDRCKFDNFAKKKK